MGFNSGFRGLITKPDGKTSSSSLFQSVCQQLNRKANTAATARAPCLCGSVQNILWCINDKNAHKAGIKLSKTEPSAHSPASLTARGYFIHFEAKIDILILWLARFWIAAPTEDYDRFSLPHLFSHSMISKSETWGQETGLAVLAK